MTLSEFEAKVQEYLTNNISAFMGAMQLTSNEKEDLKLALASLSAEDRTKANAFLSSKGIKAL